MPVEPSPSSLPPEHQAGGMVVTPLLRGRRIAMLIDSKEFRRALGRFATGVTVVTAATEKGPHGMTANAFLSVSLVPPLVLVSVDNRAKMKQILDQVRRYGVSVLSEEDRHLSDHFAGRTVSPQPTIGFVEVNGVPLIEGALAHLTADIVDAHPAGDHTLFIGQVDYMAYREGRPLVFYAGRYHRLEGEPAEVLHGLFFDFFSSGL